MKAAEWIDRAKVAQGWPSDYRAAKELGIKPNTISMYRTRCGTLDELTALKLAGFLHLDPAAILLDQAAERTKSDEVRAALLAAASRLYIMLSHGATTKRALARRMTRLEARMC